MANGASAGAGAGSGGGGFNFSMLGTFGKNVLGSAGGGMDEIRASRRNSRNVDITAERQRGGRAGGVKDSNDNDSVEADSFL